MIDCPVDNLRGIEGSVRKGDAFLDGDDDWEDVCERYNWICCIFSINPYADEYSSFSCVCTSVSVPFKLPSPSSDGNGAVGGGNDGTGDNLLDSAEVDDSGGSLYWSFASWGVKRAFSSMCHPGAFLFMQKGGSIPDETAQIRNPKGWPPLL